MAQWKKVLVSGSNISELNNDAGYLASLAGTGVFSGSAQVTLSGDITGTAASSSIALGVITNEHVAANAAITYSKIDFTGSDILSGSIDLTAYTTTASFDAFTASYATDSASVSTRVSDLENWSSSLDSSFLSEAEFNSFTASYKEDSGSWNTQIGGLNTQVGNLELSASNALVASASFSTRVTDLEGASASFESRLTADEAKYDAYTSSFTTGQLTVNGGALITGSLGVIGTASFDNNVLVQGNLTVNGTASFINIENLSVKDKFITLNSGSNNLADGGLIFQASSEGVGSGPALFLEATGTGLYGRMAMATSVDTDASFANASAYVNTTETGDGAPSAAPIFGDSLGGSGNMYINSGTGDIFIYA
jgi:hypothetical protein